MEFGSLVDCIVTRGDFDANYVVSDFVPFPAEKTVLDTLLTMTSVPFYDVPTEKIQAAIATCNYQSRLKFETQYAKLEAQKEYYEISRTGKKVISTEDYNDAMQMANAIWNSDALKSYFGKPGKDGDIEYIYQAKFLAKMKIGDEKVDVKIMPDLLVVDHKSKIVHPVDLKTSTPPGWDFKENFIKFHYALQASCYTDVLRTIMNNIPEYKEYTIAPYVFADISRSDKIPVGYVYDPKSESQKDGLTFKNYHYKGWRDLLWEIINYEKENAVVPGYIKLNELNDLVDILNNQS